MKVFKKIMFFSIIGSVLGFSSVHAASGGTGFVINPALFYQSLSVTSGGTTTATSSTLIDARLGYVLSSGLYLGGLYSMTSSSSSSTTDTMMGADIGFYSGAFSAIASYLLSAEDQTSSTTSLKGTGFALTLGYAFNAGSWGFGPQLMYSSVNYDKSVSSGTETTIDIAVTGIMPRFGLWFHF